VTPRLVLRPEAESEILDARSWYDDQQPGLGQAFVTEVDRVLTGIVEHPLAYLHVQRMRYTVLEVVFLDRETAGARSQAKSVRRPSPHR
jgi:hypothetical protein